MKFRLGMSLIYLDILSARVLISPTSPAFPFSLRRHTPSIYLSPSLTISLVGENIISLSLSRHLIITLTCPSLPPSFYPLFLSFSLSFSFPLFPFLFFLFYDPLSSLSPFPPPYHIFSFSLLLSPTLSAISLSPLYLSPLYISLPLFLAPSLSSMLFLSLSLHAY